MRREANKLMVIAVLMMVVIGACGKKPAPVARPMPPPPVDPAAGGPGRPPAPPEPIREPSIVVPPMPAEDSISGKTLDDLNRDSPLRPLFFALDSSEVDADGMKTLQDNAAIMKKYATWSVTIEGHCDERGTAEYNLALGERRALAAKNYLVSLGIPADKVKTVSYGKEFPFEAGHDDSAWSKNRRAHFVITAK
jgi:peptidoglycan-associated lipoprotein